MHRRELTTHRPGRIGRAGFTLPELLLGMLIVSGIGLAIASMLIGASYGTSSDRGLRDLLIGQQIVAVRLEEALRASGQVLAKGDDYIVLWTAERDADGICSLSELLRVERDPSTNEVTAYRAPADLSEGDDTEYDLGSTDFDAVTSALKGQSTFPGQLWAVDVTGWSFVFDTPDYRDAGYVGYQLTMIAEGVTDTAVGGIGLRNR